MQTGPPEQFRTVPKSAEQPGDGHSPGSAGRDSLRAARLNTPGMWMAWRDLRCFWLQRRRWPASYHMRREHKPPCRLIYAMVTVLSVQTRTSLPRWHPLMRLKIRRNASNWRQLICQRIWRPVYTPDTACPLYVAPQPVAEASMNTTLCLDTCSRGTPARRNEGSVHGLKVLRQAGVIWTRWVQRFHTYLGTRPWSQCWSGPIRSRPSGTIAAAAAICPRSLWKSFSETTVLPNKVLRQFSTKWARSWVRRAPLEHETEETALLLMFCVPLAAQTKTKQKMIRPALLLTISWQAVSSISGSPVSGPLALAARFGGGMDGLGVLPATGSMTLPDGRLLRGSGGSCRGCPRRWAGWGAAAGVKAAGFLQRMMCLIASVCFCAAENCWAKLSTESPKIIACQCPLAHLVTLEVDWSLWRDLNFVGHLTWLGVTDWKRTRQHHWVYVY